MYHKFVQHHNLRLSNLVMKQVNLGANDRAGEHVLIVCAEKLRLQKQALCARIAVHVHGCARFACTVVLDELLHEERSIHSRFS